MMTHRELRGSVVGAGIVMGAAAMPSGLRATEWAMPD